MREGSPKRLLSIALLGGFTFIAACTHEKPNFVYMPDMAYSPALKAQKEGAMRMPVAGTVPRGFTPYPYAQKDGDQAGRELKNPLRSTHSVLVRGQTLYNTHCIVCHGPAGEGDGTIVPKFPRPPSLQSDKVQAWTDGRIYHTVATGQNLMPSYASQIAPADRWAIVSFIRVLQRSKHPTPEDLKLAESEGK